MICLKIFVYHKKMKAYIIMYDISSQKIRNTVIKQLKKNGLYRIQKSVFLGATHKDNIKELKALFDILLQNPEASQDRYIIVPLDENILSKIDLLNIHLDLALYLGKKVVHFV